MSTNNPKVNKFEYTPQNPPRKVRLDLCNMCQLNCVECYMRKQHNEVKEKVGYGYVSFKTFKKFVDNNPFIEEIETSNDGEIFLNPDLDKIIEYAYKKNIILTAYNGVNLNTISEQTAEYLVKYRFQQLAISLDGASQETYSQYRRNGNFDNVIENIKMINRFKQKYNSQFPLLTYKFILFGHNEHEVEKAKQLAQQLNMYIDYSVNYATDFSPIKKQPNIKNFSLWNNVDDYAENSYQNYLKNNSPLPCSPLFTQPQINPHGDLVGCCSNLYYSFGNIFEKTLIEVLNSDKFIYAKRMLTDLSIPSRDDIPCTKCYIYKHLIKKNCSLVKNI